MSIRLTISSNANVSVRDKRGDVVRRAQTGSFALCIKTDRQVITSDDEQRQVALDTLDTRWRFAFGKLDDQDRAMTRQGK